MGSLAMFSLPSGSSKASICLSSLLDRPDDVDAPPPAAPAEEEPPPWPLPPVDVEVELEDDDPAVAEAAEAQPPDEQVTDVDEEAGLLCCGAG